MNPDVSIPIARLSDYCRANGITRLDVFGSALRTDFGPESDIDLLVEFDPDRTLSLLDMAGMEQELSGIFGRRVDLVERSAVERSRNYIRHAAILESTETIHVA